MYAYGSKCAEIGTRGDYADRTRSMGKVSMTEPCHCVAEVSGYIRVQDGLFVDEDCKEYMFSGYNAWEVGVFTLPGVCSRHCAPAFASRDVSL